MAWSAKAKGNYYELETTKFWASCLGMEQKYIKRTAGSGALYGLPGDIKIWDSECILNDFVIDVKSEQKLFTQKGLDYFQKNREDAQNKKSFLEVYVNYYKDSPLIMISRKDFADILRELEGYRKEQKG